MEETSKQLVLLLCHYNLNIMDELIKITYVLSNESKDYKIDNYLIKAVFDTIRCKINHYNNIKTINRTITSFFYNPELNYKIRSLKDDDDLIESHEKYNQNYMFDLNKEEKRIVRAISHILEKEEKFEIVKKNLKENFNYLISIYDILFDNVIFVKFNIMKLNKILKHKRKLFELSNLIWDNPKKTGSDSDNKSYYIRFLYNMYTYDDYKHINRPNEEHFKKLKSLSFKNIKEIFEYYRVYITYNIKCILFILDEKQKMINNNIMRNNFIDVILNFKN